MFDIGTQELIIIFVVALLVFGPKKMPELGRALGKGIRELKSALSGVTESFEETGIEEEIKKAKENVVGSLIKDAKINLEEDKAGKKASGELNKQKPPDEAYKEEEDVEELIKKARENVVDSLIRDGKIDLGEEKDEKKAIEDLNRQKDAGEAFKKEEETGKDG